MNYLNPREELVFLLRGFFSNPIITALGKLGILDIILKEKFKIENQKKIKNKKVLKLIMNYTIQLGLVQKKGNYYNPTLLGKKILSRYGSFILLHSYGSFINNLEKILTNNNARIPSCDRLENVLGSGLTNGRKFFPKSIEFLKNFNIDNILDVGCGDGFFLLKVIQSFQKLKRIGALDFSKISINETKKRLTKNISPNKFITCVADAHNIKKWHVKFKSFNNTKENSVISMWYLLHEISKKNTKRVIKYFHSLHHYFPNSHLIIGEITRIENRLLSKYRYRSIMPEFLFFHDISGQGVLTWSEYKFILKKIPYDLVRQENFDVLKVGNKIIPTGFIWHLEPKKEPRL